MFYNQGDRDISGSIRNYVHMNMVLDYEKKPNKISDDMVHYISNKGSLWTGMTFIICNPVAEVLATSVENTVREA